MDESMHAMDGLGERFEQISHDVESLSTALSGAAQDVNRYLTEHVQQNPIATLAVAAGLGYVLAGGLRSRINFMVLGMASRLFTAMAARELSARIGALRDPLRPRSENARSGVG